MGFTGNIGLETAALGKALLMGVFLGIYYDLFRILRRVFRFGYAMIIGQDLFFWLTGAVGIFFGSMVVYQGQLRIVFVLAALAGWGIYAATAGSLLMRAVDFVLKLLKHVLNFVFRHTIQPVITRSKTAAANLIGRLRARKIKLFAEFRKKRANKAQNRKNTA